MHRALMLVVLSAATLYSQAPEADTFKFRDGRGPTLSVTLEDANAGLEMTWPETVDRGWDTALLGVDVNVTLQGAAPFVEMTSAGRSDRQYFVRERPDHAGSTSVSCAARLPPALASASALRV